MGESELAAQLAAALAEKEEALRIATEVSLQRDEAVSVICPALFVDGIVFSFYAD